MDNLTDDQVDIYFFMRLHLETHQCVPTCAAIASEIGFTSASTANHHIGEMIKKGVLIAKKSKTPAYKLANVKITIEDI